MDDFVECEVSNVAGVLTILFIGEREAIFDARLVEGHAGLFDEFGEVDGVVVEVACGDEFAGRVDFVDGAAPTAGGAVCGGAGAQRSDDALSILELEKWGGQGGGYVWLWGGFVVWSCWWVGWII